MRIALITENKVSGFAEVQTEEEFEALGRTYSNLIDVTDANPVPVVGWVFNGSILVPGEGQSGTPSRKISKLKFLERFTDTELATIEGFSAGTSGYAFAVRVALRKQAVATYIDLSLPATISGVNNLVALGLLTSDRASIILDTPIIEEERYKGNE